MLPQSEDEVSRDWLREVLAPSHPDAASDIESVRLERLGESDSVTGLVLRAHIKYGSTTTSPPSVVIKLPHPRERRSPVNLLQYRREVAFYDQLAPHIAAGVPRCYWSQLDAATGDYALVLEDFPRLQPGRNEDGATDALAQLLVKEMATLHGRWWRARELNQYPFLGSLPELVERLNDAVVTRFATFLERHESFVGSDELAVLEGIHESFPELVAPLFDAPRTLTHGDLSLKNTLIGGTPEHPEVVVIDWQTVTTQPAVRDLSFFVQTSIPPAVRSQSERTLLASYHALLTSAGVDDYSFDRMFDDYRRSVLVDFARIIAFGSVPNRTSATDAVVRTSIRGRTGSARELRLDELLS